MEKAGVQKGSHVRHDASFARHMFEIAACESMGTLAG
jgi:hypothetical protein